MSLTRRTAWLLLALGSVAAAAGCGGPATMQAQDAPMRLDEPITLTVGAAAAIPAERLRVTFAAVLSDSRCPRGAQCIVAGEAVVRLAIEIAGTREERELTIPSADDAVAGAYRVSPGSLEPHPTVEREVRPSEYVLTLRVRKG